MRVLPSILDWMDSPLNTPGLFDLALHHAHSTWTDAGVTKMPGNHYVGGVVWERVEPDLYLVQHSIPNCWVANIEPSDIDFMAARDGFGAWDHDWPGKLVQEQRSRVIGSNLAAFMVEVTPAEKALAPLKTMVGAVDAFHRQHVHHSVYRQFVSVWIR